MLAALPGCCSVLDTDCNVSNSLHINWMPSGSCNSTRPSLSNCWGGMGPGRPSLGRRRHRRRRRRRRRPDQAWPHLLLPASCRGGGAARTVTRETGSRGGGPWRGEGRAARTQAQQRARLGRGRGRGGRVVRTRSAGGGAGGRANASC